MKTITATIAPHSNNPVTVELYTDPGWKPLDPNVDIDMLDGGFIHGAYEVRTKIKKGNSIHYNLFPMP